MGRLGPLSIGDGPLMGRELLAADFSFANPNPIAEFGVPTTVGLSIGVVTTVLLSGLMSGLTLGLLSLDRLDLEVMMRTGTAYEKQMAARLAPIVKYPHWVLATLVIFNTVSSVALPLCMDRLVSSVVALIVSSTAIVLFGEILPQAVCSRHGLAIGGTMAPMVRVLMWLTAPLSWPIGWLLDLLLGTKGGIFGRRQLMALVDLHRTSTGMGGPLTDDEFNVILGALDMTSKTAASNMTPLDKVFMLSTDELLDRATLQRVLESGHSRVPVYEGTDRTRIQGLIITKELLQYVGLLAGPEPPPRIGDIELRDMLQLPVSTRMYHLLDIFQTGQCHMALLTAPKSEATGAAAAKWKKGRLEEEGEEDEEEEEERERREVRSRRKRWRDKQRRRFLTLPSFTHAADDADGSNRGSPRGSPRGNEGGSRGSGDGSGSPTSPRSPRTAKDLAGGLLPCLGGDGAVRQHGENEGSPRGSGSGGGGGSRPGSRAASGGGAQNSVPPGPGMPGAGTSSGGGAKRDNKRVVSFNMETAVAPSPLVASYAAEAFHISGEPSPREPEGDGEGKAGGQEEEEQVIVGIITLEDVIEEMMGEEIVDETDAFVDNLKSTRVNARLLTMSLPPQLRRVLLSASLKRDAAVATAAALRQPTRPKLKAWSTSTPQLKASPASAAATGASGEQVAPVSNSAEGAGGASGATAAGDASASGGTAGSSGGAAMGWFGWRPVTPTKPIRIGTSPGGSPGPAAGSSGSGSAAGAAAAAGGSAPTAGAAGTLSSVTESPPRAAPAGRGPTRLSQMDRQQSA